MKNLKSCPSEAQVVELWKSLFESGLHLTTDTGEPFEVVCPGRVNDGAGPDFKDAVIGSPRGKERGSIEFHVRSGDWYVHGHDKDPSYRNVILHVAMNNDAPVSINGRAVPVLSISRYMNNSLEEHSANETAAVYDRGCANIFHRDQEKVKSLLAAAGEARFREKAARFRQEIGGSGAAQVLYRGIMGALGYVKNKTPCRDLADAVPLKDLGSCHDLKEVQSILLGTAGLLPSNENSNDDFVRSLEAYRHGRNSRMAAGSWKFFKVRPQNSPVRRIAGMSYLLQKCRGALFETIYERVKNNAEADASRLREDMVVAGDGYWRDHFGFGINSPQPLAHLIGEDRASLIVINVTLPFLYAWAGLNSEPELAEKALRLYYAFPGGGVNSVERHLEGRWGMPVQVMKTAVYRQGLLHIYNHYCVSGKCGECRLGP